jgi:capsular polysaccharide biosynthesis protein
MDLIALWKMLVRRWYLILIPAVIALVFAVPDLRTPPSGGFTTTVRVSAAQSPGDNSPTYEDFSYIPWLASEYLIDNFTIWVQTRSFGEEVAALLAAQGIEVDPGAVAGSIAADNSRSVMAMTIGWPDADQLRAIAAAAIEVLQTRNQAYFPQSAVEPPQVIALDEITIAPAPPGLLTRFQPLVKVVLGLLAGLGLAAVVELLDDSIHGREDLEELGLAVVGEIPRHKGA